jgi:hypothetical protein
MGDMKVSIAELLGIRQQAIGKTGVRQIWTERVQRSKEISG